MRTALVFALALAACGKPEPTPVDGTYRVSLEWVQNDCDEDEAGVETALVDVLLAPDGTMDLRARPWDSEGGTPFENFRVMDGRAEGRSSHTSPKGRGQQAEILSGDLTRERLDLTITSVEDSEKTHTCIRTYRLRGSRRGSDPRVVDGSYLATYAFPAQSCGDKSYGAMEQRMVVHAGPDGEGETFFNIGQTFGFSAALKPGSTAEEPVDLYFQNTGSRTDGHVLGTATSEQVSLAVRYRSQVPGQDCFYRFTVEGAPTGHGAEGEFTVTPTKRTDSCAKEPLPPGRPSLAWATIQPDGSLLLVEGERFVRLPRMGDRYERTFKTSTYLGTYVARLNDQGLSYTVDEDVLSLLGTCTKSRQMSGRRR